MHKSIKQKHLLLKHLFLSALRCIKQPWQCTFFNGTSFHPTTFALYRKQTIDITKPHHQTSSLGVVPKRHQQASSPTVVIKCRHQASSPSVLTKWSQNVVTKCRHQASSVFAYHQTSSTVGRQKASSPNIVTNRCN